MRDSKQTWFLKIYQVLREQNQASISEKSKALELVNP